MAESDKDKQNLAIITTTTAVVTADEKGGKKQLPPTKRQKPNEVAATTTTAAAAAPKEFVLVFALAEEHDTCGVVKIPKAKLTAAQIRAIQKAAGSFPFQVEEGEGGRFVGDKTGALRIVNDIIDGDTTYGKYIKPWKGTVLSEGEIAVKAIVISLFE
jgi:hypothetical protein